MNLTVRLTDELTDVAEINIVNDGTGDVDRGNYEYLIRDLSKARPSNFKGVIIGHVRKRGALYLLARILQKEFPFRVDMRYHDVPRVTHENKP